MKRFADWFLQWFCNPDYYPDIKGDLEELYQRNKEASASKAQIVYLIHVLQLFRPSLIKQVGQHSFIYTAMIGNYVKMGTRNLVKHRMFTFINIIGLTIGLIGFLLIGEYIQFERSYDTHFKDSDQIYRVSTMEIINGAVLGKDAMFPRPTAQALMDDIPEVTEATSSYVLDQFFIRYKDGAIDEKRVISGDSSFLNIFTYEVLNGNAKTLLTEPNTIVLTESKAQFYFGNQNPVGQTLEVLGSYNRLFTVTGVIEDTPETTHYKFDIIVSDESLVNRRDYSQWNWSNSYTFARLREGILPEQLDDKLAAFGKKYYDEDMESVFTLFPVTDIHLRSVFTFEPELTGSERTVDFMFLISIFIIVIAWVNYVNLSTARAIDRSKEVGLRKVIGAVRSQLISQFLLEAFIINTLAAVFALITAELLIPYFNYLVGMSIIDHVWNYPPFLLKLGIFFVIGALVSGFYPALVLSSFKPIASLKGTYRNSKNGILLRKGLVIFQFAISIILIAGTFITHRQVDYMLNKDLGMKTDFVVGISMPRPAPGQGAELVSRVRTFRAQLEQHASIDIVRGTSDLPGGGAADINSTTNEVSIPGLSDEIRGSITYIQFVEDGFMEAMEMPLLAGRYMELQNFPSDTNAVVINEALLRLLNVQLTPEIIGSQILLGDNKLIIEGVVQDFNRTSLKEAVEPTFYLPTRYSSGTVIKLNPDTYQAGLAHISNTWKEFFPDAPYTYMFLDDRFANLYEQDIRFRRIFGVFSFLAIIIATLGLFGLISFLSVQRTKEIGVRKVLGASIYGILGLFYKDFIRFIGIAAAIAIPLVYFFMNAWLESYAHRIEFPWIWVILAVVAVIISALLTVGIQTYKVAILNPAKTLKYE